MQLDEILEKMVNFEGLVEPQEMVILSSHISQFLNDYEMRYDEAKIRFSLEWERTKYEPVNIGEKPLSDKQTEIKMMRHGSYTDMLKIKRTLSELKRYRSDLNRKLDVIMGIKRRN